MEEIKRRIELMNEYSYLSQRDIYRCTLRIFVYDGSLLIK